MKRYFPVTVKLFKPSGKWYATEERMIAATDCGSEPSALQSAVLTPPCASTHDVVEMIRGLFACNEPIADGCRGEDGWFVTIDGYDVVPHLIKLVKEA